MDSKFLENVLLIFLVILTSGCLDNDGDEIDIMGNETISDVKCVARGLDYRQQMRDFVINISIYSKQKKPNFIIIPQNGQELLTDTGSASGKIEWEYLATIDGVGREDLFFGYGMDNEATPVRYDEEMIAILDIAKDNGISVLVTDYCRDKVFVDQSYEESAAREYISFAANSRALDSIPDHPAEPFNVNSNDILSLDDAQNFLYIIDPGNFGSKEEFLQALQETDYDIIIVDLFYDESAMNADDIVSLKIKSNGASRLLIAYMSVGEAEEYRYYWNDSWREGSPMWIEAENPEWGGNYKVHYWDGEWQSLIYGNEDAYLDMIVDAGFDGAYLDIIDAFEYFEDQRPEL